MHWADVLELFSLSKCLNWAILPCFQWQFAQAGLIKKWYSSRKHAYIILTPLKPHLYIVKLEFTVVFIIFLILLKNICCGYSLEPPRWSDSNQYPQSMFWAEIWKILGFFIRTLSFFGCKFSVYLNRRVFVMYFLWISLMCKRRRITNKRNIKSLYIDKKKKKRSNNTWRFHHNAFHPIYNRLSLSKVQGTLWYISRYPYLDISDLQNWGKNKSNNTSHKWICNLTPEDRGILKIWRKRGGIAP